MTTTQQTMSAIDTMQKINQQAAAWLAGVNARTLRDAFDLKRNSDGSYDAREVLNWAARRIPETKLTDDDHERVLNATEAIASNVHDYVPVLLQLLNDLQRDYGPAGWLAVMKDLQELFRNWDCSPATEKTDQELLVEIRAEMRREAARNNLRIAYVCEKCGKLRRGANWEQRTPPTDHEIRRDLCPQCEP